MGQLSLATLAENVDDHTPLIAEGAEALCVGTRAQSRDSLKGKVAPILGLSAASSALVNRNDLTRKDKGRRVGRELGHGLR